MNMEKYKSELGKRLHVLRKMKNISQIDLCSEFSKRYGISMGERTLRRYEDGEYLPSIEILFAYRHYFNVSFEFIMSGTEASNDNSYTYKDNFKRLNRLLFSTILTMNKVDDENDPLYGKHVFIAVDDETNAYLDKLESSLSNKNLSFERGEDNGMVTIKTFDQEINDLPWQNQIVLANEKRLKMIADICYESFEDYEIRKKKRIKRKRGEQKETREKNDE